ncbi:MAG: transporter [Actinobacteria bacterium]|nr:transporter [Actinomycetota bacterium]
MTKKFAAFALAALLAAAAPAAGEEDDRGRAKSGYTLFRPTPRDLMRPLSTDRPDATESPYTVDAGHFQLEADVVAYLRDVARDDGTDIRGWAFAVTNFKLGLTNTIDVQLVVETYRHEETETASGDATVDGFGDLVLRGKFNLWGNDGGPTAFALLPFVKFPTAEEGLGNDHVEGGIALPLAADLPHGFGFGAQIVVEALRNDADTGYDAGLGASATVNHALVGELSGFVEITAGGPVDAPWEVTFDTGLTYGIGENGQLDLGAFFGLNRAAPDLVLFVGITWRF